MKSRTPFASLPHFAALVCLVAFGPTAVAQSSSSDQPPAQVGNGHRRGPPPEAIAACENKAANDACSFAGRRGDTVAGKCFVPPAKPDANGGASSTPPLACRPDRMPSDEHKPGGGGS
jgi:hypothetical protein